MLLLRNIYMLYGVREGSFLLMTKHSHAALDYSLILYSSQSYISSWIHFSCAARARSTQTEAASAVASSSSSCGCCCCGSSCGRRPRASSPSPSSSRTCGGGASCCSGCRCCCRTASSSWRPFAGVAGDQCLGLVQLYAAHLDARTAGWLSSAHGRSAPADASTPDAWSTSGTAGSITCDGLSSSWPWARTGATRRSTKWQCQRQRWWWWWCLSRGHDLSAPPAASQSDCRGGQQIAWHYGGNSNGSGRCGFHVALWHPGDVVDNWQQPQQLLIALAQQFHTVHIKHWFAECRSCWRRGRQPEPGQRESAR